MQLNFLFSIPIWAFPLFAFAVPAVRHDGHIVLAGRQTDGRPDAAAVDATNFDLDDTMELEPIVDSEDVGLTKRGESMGLQKKLKVKWGNGMTSSYTPTPLLLFLFSMAVFGYA